jgi:large subunit ribosomal protein L2
MSGRNSSGRITVRHRGSQLCKKVVKCITRVYSYMRYIPFYVCSFEHCQGVRHLVSLILFINGLYLYVPTLNVFEKKGFSFFYSVRGGVIPFEGGSYPLKLILIGSLISNIELKPLSGASLSRSAGSFSVVIQRNLYDCWLRLSSGVIRIVSFFCSAILGSMGCSMIKLSCFGSAGKLRLVGFKPKVRGVAMNPIDHPHGGGEGRSSGGRPSVSPWSFYTKGKKTRNPRKSLSYVVIMSGDLNSLKKKKVRL